MGEIKENAEVENVSLSYESLVLNINDKLNGKNVYIGSVAGQNYGTIKNVKVTKGNIKITCDAEIVATTYVGGIAGAVAGGLSGLGKKGARIATAGSRASIIFLTWNTI